MKGGIWCSPVHADDLGAISNLPGAGGGDFGRGGAFVRIAGFPVVGPKS